MSVATADVGYRGRARLTTRDGTGLDVEVVLRGRHSPLDGRYHWWGRVSAPEPGAAAWTSLTGSCVVLRTGDGDEAAGRLSDLDPWGRLRVSGTSRPPFPVLAEVEEVR